MVGGSRGISSPDLDRACRDGSVVGLSEGELLGRFVARRDEVAFEALVARHGPMVLGVCRRILGSPHAAADAFQATFLVLVRRAASVRDGDLLGPWLHGVALRVATRARADAARRRDRESQGGRPEAWEATAPLERAELRGILDEELSRLPERYRRPIILCDLEGDTHAEAARRLRCTLGMLRGRLDRGRAKLRSRLDRRGLAPSASWVWTMPAARSLPESLARATVAAATSAPAAGASLGAIKAASGSGARHAAVLGRFALVASILGLAGIVLAGPRSAPRVAVGPALAPPTPARPLDGVNLTGRALDRDGRSIPGARVRRGPGLGPEVVTDRDGRFAFPSAALGPAILTVQAANHAPDLRSLEVALSLPPVEFRLGPGRSIRGQVVDFVNRPIAGAPIAAGPWRGQTTLDWRGVTDADGRYRWDHAPDDEVLVDLGTMGFTSKRFLSFPPGQNERDLTMPRPRFARGSVTDAVTGRPIERFTVLTGHGAAGGTQVEWEDDEASTGSGGTYQAKLGAEYRAFDRFVRIEAEGYLPARSRALADDEAEWDRVVDFRLQPGDSAIAGVVQLPDGSPLAEAEVTLVTTTTSIADGRLTNPRAGRRVRTGPDGRFRFPPVDPPFAVVVLHDRGHAERTAAEFTSEAALTLRPWGRVEGTYRVGNRAGVNQGLGLTRIQPDAARALLQFNDHTTVDAEGHFAFEHVADGAVVVAQSVQQGNFGTLYPLDEPSRVDPGATTRWAIGGTGRPVVGRFDLPAALAGQADWTWSHVLLIADAGPRRTFVGEFLAQGGFRIEDVPAGSYTLIVEIKKSPAGSGPGFADPPIASARRQIEMPVIPGGRSDEPLDVGVVPLTPEG